MSQIITSLVDYKNDYNGILNYHEKDFVSVEHLITFSVP